MGAITGRGIRGSLWAACAALLLLVLAPAAAKASVAHPGLDYDLDGSAAPVPAALNQLDLYTPDGATGADSRPVVVYVHGGGWSSGNKSNKIAKKVALFTGAGYVFASVNYRLSPDPATTTYEADRIRFPVHPRDVGEAVAWIDENVASFGGDPTRILLIGHSAGAHLVSLISTDPSYVEAYGMDPRHLIGTVSLDTDAYDVTDRLATGGPQAQVLFHNAFATAAENAVDDTWAEASPINHAGPKDPDFLFVTQAAVPGRVQSSREMAEALGQDPTSSVLLAPYDHEGINDAVGSTDDPAGETEAIMSFFERMVASSQTSKTRLVTHPKSKVAIRKGKRAKLKFKFEAANAAASFECRLDGKSFRRCASPAAYDVRKGRHTFRVRAIASNGDAGPVKKWKFRVKRKR
jgi:arylformamidase